MDIQVEPWDGLHGTERYAVCLHAARTGNRVALAALVKDLTPLVWHVARGNGLDRGTAEDVVRTVWLASVRRIHAFDHLRMLINWLIMATRGEARRQQAQAG